MDSVLPDDQRPVRNALGHTALMSSAASPVFVPAVPFIVEVGAMSAGKAPEDGVYTVNGGRFYIRAGDDLPPGAVFEKAETESKVPGPSKNTEAVGPTETTETAKAVPVTVKVSKDK